MTRPNPAQMSIAQHMQAALMLGLPLVGSHLAQFAIQIVDTIMLGWYGVNELAAVALASSYFFMLLVAGSGPAWAVVPMVASASEQGDDTKVRRLTRMALWASAGIAVLCLPLLWFSAAIFQWLGQDPELSLLAQDYLRIAGFGLFPSLGVMVLRSYLSALERTRVVLWATLIAALMNGLINYALIFGNWGAPELGVRGAAIASVFIQVLAGVILATYAQRTLPQHSLFVRIWRPDWEALRDLMRLGVPIGMAGFAEVGLFSASTLVMGLIGTLELAAHGIALQITSGFFMVHLGLSSAATVRAGRAFGRRDETALRRGGVAVSALSGMFGALTVVLFLGVPDQMTRLFLDPNEPLRDEIMATARSLLAVAALFQFADAAQKISQGLLNGVQDTKVPMIMATLSYWIIGVPLSYVMGIWWGWRGEGVWLGLVIGLLVAGVLMSRRFWMRSSRIAQA